MLIARLLLLFLACNLATFAAAQDGTETDDGLLVFIGEKISVEAFDKEERFAEEDAAAEAEGGFILRMDAGVDAHYRVLDVVKGDYDRDEIKFTAWDHYGRFSFAGPDYVLLYVWKTDKGYVHAKYTYDEVFPLRSGGFAGCGNPYLEYYFDERSKLRPVPLREFDYAEPQKLKLSDLLLPKEPELEAGEEPYTKEELAEYSQEVEAAQDWALKTYAPPVYHMEDASTLVCKMGVSVEALVDARWKARFLPNLRRGECNEQLELDGYRDVKEREAKRPLLDACIADKIANDGRD